MSTSSTVCPLSNGVPPLNWGLWLGLLLLVLGASPVRAQEKISLRDATEMTYQAQSTVEGLQNLLNYVTFNDNVPSELAGVIKNSYTPSKDRIFVNGDVIIEDDTDPTYSASTSKDLSATKYLNVFDLQYEKTSDASIAFSKIQVSKVKKKEYLYVKVRFNEQFASTYKLTGKPYPLRQREALVRLFNLGNNKWQALIAGINFYDPSATEETTEEDLQITTDASATADVVSQEDFIREKEDFVFAKQQEERRNQSVFDEYVTLGNSYILNKQYKDALDLFVEL
jgi:hypothetical protein